MPARRGARDVALSLWSQHFAHPDMAWSYRFDGIADQLQRHAAAMAGIDALVATGQWRAVEYERLVSEPDAVTDELHAWLGLSTPENDPASGAAPIVTASVWQARQPVYATSVARWRHYLPHVPELAGFEP